MNMLSAASAVLVCKLVTLSEAALMTSCQCCNRRGVTMREKHGDVVGISLNSSDVSSLDLSLTLFSQLCPG